MLVGKSCFIRAPLRSNVLPEKRSPTEPSLRLRLNVETQRITFRTVAFAFAGIDFRLNRHCGWCCFHISLQVAKSLPQVIYFETLGNAPASQTKNNNQTDQT